MADWRDDPTILAMEDECLAWAEAYGLDPIYHMPAMVTDDGRMSALCYDEPHEIPFDARDDHPQLWTIRTELVNCEQCLARMETSHD